MASYITDSKTTQHYFIRIVNNKGALRPLSEKIARYHIFKLANKKYRHCTNMGGPSGLSMQSYH